MMIPSADLAVVLLAAGQSRRFGAANKLLAPLADARPLVTWAAQAAPEAAHRIAVCTSAEVEAQLIGWDVVRLEGAPPQSQSLKAGIARAEALGARYALVMLGDMPLISKDLIVRLLRHPEGATAFNGETRLPPAVFPAALFGALQGMEGDRGAGPLLKTLPLEAASPEELADIDTEEALARLVQRTQNFSEH